MKLPQTHLLLGIFSLDCVITYLGEFFTEGYKLWCRENIIPAFLL